MIFLDKRACIAKLIFNSYAGWLMYYWEVLMLPRDLVLKKTTGAESHYPPWVELGLPHSSFDYSNSQSVTSKWKSHPIIPILLTLSPQHLGLQYFRMTARDSFSPESLRQNTTASLSFQWPNHDILQTFILTRHNSKAPFDQYWKFYDPYTAVCGFPFYLLGYQ